jgi:hypothetical protein
MKIDGSWRGLRIPGASGSFGSAGFEMLGTCRFSDADLRLLEVPRTRSVFL